MSHEEREHANIYIWIQGENTKNKKLYISIVFIHTIHNIHILKMIEHILLFLYFRINYILLCNNLNTSLLDGPHLPAYIDGHVSENLSEHLYTLLFRTPLRTPLPWRGTPEPQFMRHCCGLLDSCVHKRCS